MGTVKQDVSRHQSCFGDFTLDLERGFLYRGLDEVKLRPKPFEVLAYLVRHPDRLVTKDELIGAIWPDACITDNSLAQCLLEVRRALADDAQQLIRTVPRRGYIFTNPEISAPDVPRGVIEGAFVNSSEPGVEGLDEPAALFSGAQAFVGRERETRRLAGHLQRMIGGAGKLVFLTGEAGIGKSALAEEFMRSARRRHPGLILATGRAVEQYGTGEAYLPFLDALSALLREAGDWLPAALRANAPTWCLQLPSFASSGDLDQLRRETIGATKDRMLREMGDALAALSSTAPLLILLEDLHWADPSTVDLLRHLCHRVAGQRVLLLVTFRPEGIQTGNHPLKNCKIEMQAHQQCDEIALEDLNAKDIANFLDLRFHPNDFPHELSGLIWTKTEGQPLFTVGLLEFLSNRGDIVNTNTRWRLTRPLDEMDLEIPESVRAMIRRKSEALESGSQLALQYASVQGEEFLSTVLARLLDTDDLSVEEQLATLARTHRLIELRGEEELPDGSVATRYAFAHSLYQNVFYDELVSKRRALLHARAGEQLLLHYGDRAPRIAVQLAIHFERGRDWARAIEFLLHAGANARSVFANTQAEGHYTHALDLAAKLPLESRAETELRIYEKRAAVYLATSRFDPSIADSREMIDRARTIGSPALECAALFTLGNTLFWAHRLDEMQTVLEDVLRLARRTQSESARLQAIALIAQGHFALGELDDAENKFQEVIGRASLVDKRTLLGVLELRARLRFFQSEYVNAEKMFREALALASELGDAFEILKSHYFLTLTLVNMGRIAEALAVLNRAIEMARVNGAFSWSSKVPNCLGWIHRELQDFEGAMSFDREGAETAHRLGVGEAEVNSVINLAFDQLHGGDKEGICSAVKSAESILSHEAWFRWRFEIRLQAMRAEQTLSRQEAVCLLEKATRYHARKYMVAGHTLLARIAMAEGNTATAEAELNAATGILHDFPVPLAAWKTYSVLGRFEAQLGRQDAARAAFSEAASVIGFIADNICDERLLRIFLDSAAVRETVSGLT
jgi:DNA-binding winged helix-turn-helix (wHTH) protein/tetratricopeptide (TPR) repeat protein